jgi:hypothetical protein
MSSWAHARTPRPRIRAGQSRPSKVMCLQAAEPRTRRGICAQVLIRARTGQLAATGRLLPKVCLERPAKSPYPRATTASLTAGGRKATSHQSAVYRLWTGSAGGPVLDGLEEAEAGSSSWDAWANSATSCPPPRSRRRASLRPGAGTITADRCHTSNPAAYLPDQGGLAIGLAVAGAIPLGHRAPAVR